jgi:1,4-dihydroxy-2-naphthoate octaprenyltransferase
MSALLWSFIIIHFFLYPASNGYNSYFDKDEKSIGVLKNPPPVKKGLYHLAIFLDVIAVIMGYLMINITFSIMLLIYGLVSKAYSHPSVRLKKYPVISWLITGLFQGIFSFIMCYVGINKFDFITSMNPMVIFAGAATTLMLWANYPMTQIYQHEEDAKHGDTTMSMLLGIKGTFYFVGSLFTIVAITFVTFFLRYYSQQYAFIFLLALLPVVSFFFYWFLITLKNLQKANYENTMWLNFISATCLNVFFVYFFLSTTHVLQSFQ